MTTGMRFHSAPEATLHLARVQHCRSPSVTAFIAFLLLLLSGPVHAAPQQQFQEKRVALVIGNGAYQNLPPLQNPSHDAEDIAASLRSLGFGVVLGTDVDKTAWDATLNQFLDLAKTADVALFYYAGHGFQLATQNYIVPVDARLESRQDIERHAIRLHDVLGKLDSFRGTRIIFLDACRDNPVPASMRGATDTEGLSEVSGSAGLFIAFATQPGNFAYDGGGGRNSFFTRAVLSHIGTRGVDLGGMMIAVRNDVIAATGGAQVPWDNSSIVKPFQFAPGPVDTASPELRLWQVAASQRDLDLMGIYVDRYPDGAHVSDALALLRSAAQAAGQEQHSVAASTTSEEALWESARQSRWRPLVDHYMRRFPQGRHADEARHLLDVLPEAGTSKEEPEETCERLATHPRDATASVAGVSLAKLKENAPLAIAVCQMATAAHPDLPHFDALLARALAAAGRTEDAVQRYKKAAERGDLRAMVSLGLLMEEGTGVPRDVGGAVALYERAAEKGSGDAAVNLAVALLRGIGTTRDLKRALALLKNASDNGSAQATLNLGVLADRGLLRSSAKAFEYFRKAAALGEPRAYIRAAILLDEGRGTKKDPSLAADLVLTGVASDYGEAATEIGSHGGSWSLATRKSLQEKLRAVGYYKGAADGVVSPALMSALSSWRANGGLDLQNGY